MDIRDLTEVSLDQLHEAMLDAYSDYVVPMTITREHFERMLVQRAFTPVHSRGAFEGDTLVAFWFVGMSEDHEPKALYGIAVGTRPPWRRKGLTEKVFEPVVRNAPGVVSKIVLECLTNNDRALPAYEKLGFQRRRRVVLSRGNFRPLKGHPTIKIEEVSLREARDYSALLQTWMPTWQNSFGALEAFPDEALCLTARNQDGLPIGLGCFARKSRQIHQLSVPKGPKRKEITTTLLHAAQAENGEQPHFVNIDASDEELLDVMASHGWEHYGDQYEMILNLSKWTKP